MGQSATLYRISQSDFPKIIEHSKNLDISNFHKGYRIFDKSFDGLVFILSKNQNAETIQLVSKTFYPETYIDNSEVNEVGITEIDFENLPDNFDFESFDKPVIFYNDFTVVTAISSFLESFTVEVFMQSFDHNVLNEQGIYPYGAWNNEIEEDVGFNVTHMIEEFLYLKSIFAEAKSEGDYMLSFVG